MSEAQRPAEPDPPAERPCWAYGHETEDEPVCIHCGQPVQGA